MEAEGFYPPLAPARVEPTAVCRTLGGIVYPAPVPARVGAGPRAALRAAQAAHGAATAAAREAAEIASRGRAAATAAAAALAAYHGLDDQVAAHHARVIRAGSGGTGLPPDLVAARRERREAEEATADAAAAAGMLDDEAAGAAAEAGCTGAALRAAIVAVMRGDAADLVGRMRDAEREAGRLRMLLAGFASGWSIADVAELRPVPESVAMLAHEPAAGVLLALAGTGRAGAADAWACYRRDLATDADAPAPDL